MSELFIEFFSEEIPPNLQISARNQFQKLLVDKLSEALNTSDTIITDMGFSFTSTHQAFKVKKGQRQ